ncbi:SDR family NAD(P)-dependent oxidoreductase [Crenobacter caeni]|uniref:SDR family oxidoreductase n=1 Tax=Crenobacter caeni TaxID=2705474 RepID=A0A6B2KRY3_9NEIS|nr:SDR family oxidoreductase [Crenobacter caeni]NDV12719.1 SDR family oxidoreductase [Crenobacter caeni]
MFKLTGRAAIVTGAGGGIGQGIAHALADAGATVFVAEIDRDAGAACAEAIRAAGHRAHFVHTDVTSRASLEALVDTAVREAGRLDILVNNAWRGRGLARVEALDDDALEGGFTMAVLAAQRLMRAAFPHLKAGGCGRVISLCSLNGVNAHLYSADYNAAKEALRALTRSAAREWAEYGICCNVICPGAASEAYRRFAETNPDNAARIAQANPMGRVGDPLADIAPVAVFLAGDASRYLTGNTLFVDGGAHINGVAWAPARPA